MIARLLLLAAICALLGTSPLAADQHWTLEDAPLDQLPSGWSAAKTGQGAGSVWKVRWDETAPAGPRVLTQTSSAGPNHLFNLCVAQQTCYRDLDLTVAFKALSGRFDQGGGPVWRYQDANNYYVARMNPLESNFRLYKVINGRRRQLDSADVAAPAGQWHTIRIVHRGNHIQCFFDGKLLLDVHDDTLSKAGKVGLWTKADAVTSFDDLRVSEP